MAVAGDVVAASPAVRDEVQERPSVPRLGYQPALDGLRAIAAGSVLLYHGGVNWSSGGFLGVDVFFVLSGFLITALLLTEWERTGTIAVVAFYGRRLRRLLPALLLVIAAVALYAVTLAPTSQIRELRGDLFSTFGYFTNWRLIAANRGYFDAFAAPSPLKHTWSLAVEEQWYLIWPIVVIGLLHFTRARDRDLRPAAYVVAGARAASTIWMAILYHPGGDPSRVYYGTDTRAQELLAGALVAFVCVIGGRYTIRSPWRALVGVAGAVALAWTLYLFVTVDDRTTWLYQGGLLVFSFAITAIIVSAVQPQSIVRTLLSPAPLRWLGTISYGLYLWHWPIYVACTTQRTGLDGAPLLVLRLVLTVAAATASYYLVEAPIRHRTFSMRSLAVAFPTIVVVTVAVIVLVTQSTTAQTTDLASTADAVHGTSDPAAIGTDFHGLGLPQSLLDDPATRRVGVVGDSVALTLSFGFPQGKGKPAAILSDHSALGCSLFPAPRVFNGTTYPDDPPCAPWRASRARWLDAYRPDVVALLGGVWEVYDREVDGKQLDFGTNAFDAWFAQNLDGVINELGSTGAHVALLTAPCNERTDSVTGPEPPENDNARVDHLNQLYREAAARHAQTTTLVDLHGYLCPNGTFEADRDGTPLRSDGVHFAGPGAQATWTWLLPQVKAMITR